MIILGTSGAAMAARNGTDHMTPGRSSRNGRLGRIAIATLVCSVALLARAPAVRSREYRPPPPFKGDSLPTPPQQNAPWTPPETALPQEFVKTTRRLFDLGMADPRGLEYREVEVGTGRVWRRTGIVETHGWLLPAHGGKQRFAVCWNGLVYPVVSVGAQADARADAELALVRERERREERIRETRNAWPDMDEEELRLHVAPWYKAPYEAQLVWHDSVTSLKAPMLLRLGYGDLAHDMWTTWRQDRVFP
ncbi:MAG: hypothetical protein KAX19_02250, partial [Candidatus Brocadiae bacterium]|nr:hypothetical protein [Candidatus Brocadiia bacterium]